MTKNTLKFGAFRHPALQAGTYSLHFQQAISLDGKVEDARIRRNLDFVVRGERWNLPREDVKVQFPPAGGKGNYGNCLPHLCIRNASLPWQRTAIPGQSCPWLALLVFSQDEIEECESKQMKLSEIQARYPRRWAPEPGEEPNQECRLLLVPERFQNLIQTDPESLKLLTHTQSIASTADQDETYAVVLARRLPESGQPGRAVLVSMESCFDAEGQFHPARDEEGNLLLPVLYDWIFHSVPPDTRVHSLLAGLTRNTAVLASPVRDDDPQGLAQIKAAGYALVPYHFREGQVGRAFYRSPFLPGQPSGDVLSPAASPDKLIRWLPGSNIPDLSLSMAWQLGRLLALADRDYANGLRKWKQARQLRSPDEEDPFLGELKQICGLEKQEAVQWQEAIGRFLANLRLLDRVPFPYLVPDRDALPPESLRFFQVDSNWVKCLLDGALSIGGRHAGGPDQELEALAGTGDHSGGRSGVLIRSELVRNWDRPRLSGRDREGKELTQLSMRKLGEDLILVLFAGTLASLVFRQSGESLHFGFSAIGPDGSHGFSKTLRDPLTGKVGKETVLVQPDRNRNLPVLSINRAMRASSSGEFALQLAAGLEEVSFTVNAEPIPHD